VTAITSRGDIPVAPSQFFRLRSPDIGGDGGYSKELTIEVLKREGKGIPINISATAAVDDILTAERFIWTKAVARSPDIMPNDADAGCACVGESQSFDSELEC
jgi:hypothetical protein